MKYRLDNVFTQWLMKYCYTEQYTHGLEVTFAQIKFDIEYLILVNSHLRTEEPQYYRPFIHTTASYIYDSLGHVNINKVDNGSVRRGHYFFDLRVII